ncbi:MULTISPECIES: Crp/Fnr family transcriptional regulator [Sphingobacterium]|jgi:CRP-like cAMP-binding protein|uniref:Crp/Fnr family transcriptional regulator n=1 Tax=Sphingobacterium paramultivorum TaxID=2886510 RepID=A0A7G5E3T9_9SPHI|nr:MULTISPECIES: Crp/Fnr family transcriptional regulator [Sphingobacterium]MCS4167744.1 CRP-like cAMP-binding protein [Sphingobacterium sp. BIGb0116]QMV68664.1 Crp/Fnr family transcriptional regulator [Sphingobacterium paramultivorum]WET69632.1 MAG: Crp/Fnr family transcriptional regulator [Sphingobacterium sp.]WSO12424.1 Crp/Fnr family transcriptional regulator [Sphingobacterium paramultivorum]
MLYENILKNVSKCITLTAEETEQFTGLLTAKKVPKKTMLLEEGEVCQFEGYLQKGCVRIYYLDENGFEVTLAFAVEDWWISDIASFHYHTPSSLYMETLEDSEFLMLTPETKERLLETVPKFERVFRMLVQRRLAVLQNRLIHTMAKPAADRYLEFIELYPTISQRVPQYYIASYLGVSPEFVSIIRKRLAAKK